MTTRPPNLELSKSQQSALDLLRQKLGDLAKFVTSANGSDSESMYWIPEFHVSNVTGLLGGRGSGKTTILLKLYHERHRYSDQNSKLFFVPPLDCSIIPPEITPGTSVLLRLQDSLINYYKIKIHSDTNNSNKSNWNKRFTELEELIQLYTRLDASYRDLCLELSSSPGDYGYHVIRGVKERLQMAGSLKSWLTKMLDNLDHKVFVILLDDFDLIPARSVRHWLFSLLDELYQSQIIFVITADFHRLEHLSLDEQTQLDDITGRALVNKLLPSQNRINLTNWEPVQRAEFRLPGYTIPLWDLISNSIKDSPALTQLVPSLLPSLPRGLVNLYSIYADENQSRKHNIKLFLERLAGCRSEPLLARRLVEKKLEDWVHILHFREEDLCVEDWQEMISAAVTRANTFSIDDHTSLPALIYLTPVITINDLRASIYHSHQDDGDLSPSPGHVSVELFESINRDVALRDPLRHETLRILPLRDAVEEDQPLWAELLINLGFADNQLNCTRFLDKWKPARSRSQSSQLRIQLYNSVLREFFLDNVALQLRPILCWISPASDANHFMIGWHTLLQALRGEIHPLLPSVLDDLLINPGSLKGELPSIGTPAALSMLPYELWAIIVFIDALSRCPWTDFSSSTLGFKVATYLGLAAAFVHSAYAYALWVCKDRQMDCLSEVQHSFITMVDKRDPYYLLRMQEDDILVALDALFRANDLRSQLCKPENSLTRAALAYLESPVYTAVVDLVAAQPEVSYFLTIETQGDNK